MHKAQQILQKIYLMLLHVCQFLVNLYKVQRKCKRLLTFLRWLFYVHYFVQIFILSTVHCKRYNHVFHKSTRTNVILHKIQKCTGNISIYLRCICPLSRHTATIFTKLTWGIQGLLAITKPVWTRGIQFICVRILRKLQFVM